MIKVTKIKERGYHMPGAEKGELNFQVSLTWGTVYGDFQNCNKWIVVIGVVVLSIILALALNSISEKLKK